MTRPNDAPTTFANGPMVEVRRSARSRRAPSRYEPEERPEDDFDGSESEGEGDSESESEEEAAEGGGGAAGAPGTGSDSDDDTAGSLRDFLVDDEDEGPSDGEADTDMLEDSDPEGYTTTEDDEMDWSPGRSSRTDSESESEGDDESDGDGE